MNLTPEQESALAKVKKWLSSGSKKPFKLFGAAGTGKSTLAKYIGDSVNRVRFLCYTGKAAHVLQKKGCPATTVHSQIYTVQEKDKSELRRLEEKLTHAEGDTYLKLESQIRKLKAELSSPSFSLNPNSPIQDADLVIIDECSMVNEKMGRDLLSFKVPILVLGDCYQLPPVKGAGFFTYGTPDVLLKEVHRQAKESGILRLATDLRNGTPVWTDGYYGPDVRIVTRAQFKEEIRPTIRPPTQVIVGTNETRHKANDILRAQRGLTSIVPQQGDRVICLRNNHESGLLNGAQFDVLGCWASPEDEYLRLQIKDEDGNTREVKAHREIFQRTEVNWRYAREAEWFDFSDCITCHRAQGSEWEEVVVIDESRRFYSNRKKWSYTAATRAAERLVWVTS